MSFYVGQKVVCVRAIDLANFNKNYSSLPKENNIYTIRRVSTDCCDTVWLNEILGGPSYYNGEELGFWAKRFRPVIERPTDISIFTRLLNPTNHRHLEEV